ncbi:MAG: (2Fe-2S) ferredoxin domain-containing protein, partial [Dehalococcoidia bacterium]
MIMARLKSAADLEQARQKILSKRDPTKPCVTICSGTGCHALGSDKVYEALVSEISKNGLRRRVDLRRTGCH